MEEKLWNEIRIRKIKAEKSACILEGFPVRLVKGTVKERGHLPYILVIKYYFLQGLDDIELSGYVKRRQSTDSNAAQSKLRQTWQIRSPPTPTMVTDPVPLRFFRTKRKTLSVTNSVCL